MTEEMIVGRKAIIEYLRGPLQLSSNHETAWRKIRRWKKDKNMAGIFHRLPGDSPYIVKSEFLSWLKHFDDAQRPGFQGAQGVDLPPFDPPLTPL